MILVRNSELRDERRSIRERTHAGKIKLLFLILN